MSPQGYILSLDALLALLIAGFLISATLYLLGPPGREARDEVLYRIAMDYLTVVEKDGSLSRAMIEAAINSTLPVKCIYTKLDDYAKLYPSVCMTLRIRNESHTWACAGAVDDPEKCTHKGEESVIVHRTFIAQEQPFDAEMEVWYKK